ncbi:metal-sensitive transcriptional regulator [Propionibacterium sp.]|uniref:metal-sensitive transcriptional regulator n=1 Tax=Propionibacterium sp. TaxID=1977903 RepID=UPI0039E9AC9B
MTEVPNLIIAEAVNGCACGSADGGSSGDCHHEYGYLDNKDAYLKRLRRIEGQVRGLQRMVVDEKYCIDILTQISATTKALQSVALAMLDEHMSSCVVRAAREGGDEAEIKLAEASDAIARLVRS